MSTSSPKRTAAKKFAVPKELGDLPEWNLSDLYAGVDDPKVKRDLDRADEYSKAFEDDFKGKLAALLDQPDGAMRLRRRSCAMSSSTICSAGSPRLRASCMPAIRSIPPARSSMAMCRTASRRRPRISCSSCSSSIASTTPSLRPPCAEPKLAYYRPWLEDIRKEKPYQLEDRVEQLFHEKSVTGYGAWNRLFDETIARLRFRVGQKSLAIEPTLSLLQDPDGRPPQGGRGGAGQDLQGQPSAVCADHQHARQGQGDLRPLARVQGHRGFPPSLQPGRARGGGGAGVGGARRLSAALASLLRPEGQLVRQDAARTLGPQRAVARGRSAHHRVERGAGDRAHRLPRVLTRHGRDCGTFLCAAMDRCAGASRQGAGRFRASDRAVGASVRAAQLSGQAA